MTRALVPLRRDAMGEIWGDHNIWELLGNPTFRRYQTLQFNSGRDKWGSWKQMIHGDGFTYGFIVNTVYCHGLVGATINANNFSLFFPKRHWLGLGVGPDSGSVTEKARVNFGIGLQAEQSGVVDDSTIATMRASWCSGHRISPFHMSSTDILWARAGQEGDLAELTMRVMIGGYPTNALPPIPTKFPIDLNRYSLAVPDSHSHVLPSFDERLFGKVWDFDADGTPYNDVTTDAGDDGAADVTFMRIDAFTESDYLYVGDAATFFEIKFLLSTVAVGLTAVWEYWNGSAWTALTVDDNTENLANSGVVVFEPPSDWATTAVNGSTQFWVRLSTSSDPSTAPVGSFIRPNASGEVVVIGNASGGTFGDWVEISSSLDANYVIDGASVAVLRGNTGQNYDGSLQVGTGDDPDEVPRGNLGIPFLDSTSYFNSSNPLPLLDPILVFQGERLAVNVASFTGSQQYIVKLDMDKLHEAI